MATSILDSKRITKEEAAYEGPQERESKAEEKREESGGEGDRDCDDCTMFRAPHGCTLVIGHIDPEGVCKYFERKK